MHRIARHALSAFALAACLASGCATPPGSSAGSNPTIPVSASTAVLRSGDSLIVTLQGVPDLAPNSVQIDEQGLITLPFIGSVKAAGMSTAELSQQISATYIARRIYVSITASVTVTERYVYVGGEVASPGRIVWSPDLTATKAIQSAGGFSLYARETAVSLTRDGNAYIVDLRLAQRSPSEDPRLMPGDSLQVARSPF